VSTARPSIGGLRDRAARRDLDWTGERMLPWTDDPAMAYEHLHRYAFATQLAEGRRVLDLGCGEGYGSALLATRASSVVGVDADARAIAHAVATYRAENLGFAATSADDLSAFDVGSFDLVVCFEMIEHVEAQERVVAEARRVLGPDGLFVCSTPERNAYRAQTGQANTFHVRELDLREFQDLIGAAFPSTAVWSQRTLSGSVLEPLASADAAGTTVYVERSEGYWDVRERPEPLYLVAVASAGALPTAGLSVLADPGLLLYEQQRERAERAELELHEARVERAEAEERLVGYRDGMRFREGQVKDLVALTDGLRAEMLAAGDAAAARIEELDQRVAEVESSSAWRVAQSARARLTRPDGTPNLAARAASSLTAALARRLPPSEPRQRS
jgi:O-antigen biosynthesis protein